MQILYLEIFNCMQYLQFLFLEYTLVTFLLHSVGAAVSKLHQVLFSPIQQQVS